MGKVSAVIGACTRKGYILRKGRDVQLTSKGIDALLETGWVPGEIYEDGRCVCGCPCHELKVTHEIACCVAPGEGVDD